jgi:Flp pilus assembly pilin Flp
MVQILWLIRDKVLSFLREERAQDTFEYILIIGVVSVALIAAMVAVPGLFDTVMGKVTTAVTDLFL